MNFAESKPSGNVSQVNKSAAGIGKPHVLRESLPDRVKHQLLLAEIGLPDQANVLIDVVALQKSETAVMFRVLLCVSTASLSRPSF